MRVLLLTLSVCAFATARNNNPNIPVDTGSGYPYFVDPEKLLEVALYPSLRQFGVIDIDVDDIQHESAAFEVELSATNELADDFQGTLMKILNSELGLHDVTVKLSPYQRNNWRHYYGAHKTTFYLYFNPSTFVDQMTPIAKKVITTTNLSLEDSMWD